MKPSPSRLRLEATPDEQIEHDRTPIERVRYMQPPKARDPFKIMMDLLRSPRAPCSACRPRDVSKYRRAT